MILIFSVLTNTALVSAVTIVSSLFGALGISSYLSTKGKNKADKEFKETQLREEAYKKQLHEDQMNEIRNIFDEKILPLKDSLDKLSAQSAEINKGTVVLLRDRMRCSLQYCKKQGYCDSADHANWMEMYNEYKALGGNHFAEYINAWKTELDNLPVEKPKAVRKTQNTKGKDK